MEPGVYFSPRYDFYSSGQKKVKGNWSKEEDEWLLKGIREFGEEWKKITEKYFITTEGDSLRSSKSCYSRYITYWQNYYEIEEIQAFLGPIQVVRLKNSRDRRIANFPVTKEKIKIIHFKLKISRSPYPPVPLPDIETLKDQFYFDSREHLTPNKNKSAIDQDFSSSNKRNYQWIKADPDSKVSNHNGEDHDSSTQNFLQQIEPDPIETHSCSSLPYPSQSFPLPHQNQRIDHLPPSSDSQQSKNPTSLALDLDDFLSTTNQDLQIWNDFFNLELFFNPKLKKKINFNF